MNTINQIRTKKIYPDNVIVWFPTEHMIEVFMPQTIQDDRIGDFLMGLLHSGEVRLASERREVNDDFASYAVLACEDNRLLIQQRIADHIKALGYKPILE